MPVVAVVGAVVAGAIAAPAVGAFVGGAALSLTGALEITTAVGATMSAVGSVTGDKGLTTAGAIVGGVGAVGSLVSSSGLLDSASSLFGDGANVAGQTATAAASSVPDSVNVTRKLQAAVSGATWGLTSSIACRAGSPSFVGLGVSDESQLAGGAYSGKYPNGSAASGTYYYYGHIVSGVGRRRLRSGRRLRWQRFQCSGRKLASQCL